jgi:hypothetical protein
MAAFVETSSVDSVPSNRTDARNASLMCTAPTFGRAKHRPLGRCRSPMSCLSWNLTPQQRMYCRRLCTFIDVVAA